MSGIPSDPRHRSPDDAATCRKCETPLFVEGANGPRDWKCHKCGRTWDRRLYR